MYIIFILIILVVLLVPIFLYNNLVSKRNAVDNAFYSMDVMLKKRFDLIPMLVDTVKGYAAHEKDILAKLTALRQTVNNGTVSYNDKVAADNELGQVIQTLFVAVENYPVLKASDNFLRLQGAINETEEQLAASRRFYNTAVKEYHDAIGTFPSSIMAGWAGMKSLHYFTISEKDKEVPNTRFNA
ncbi:MAG: LemA family protein [Bacteroidetes bacterium]|nr:LemA family protein [Bacteroidota bacterium]